jgi:hypothetical protein
VPQTSVLDSLVDQCCVVSKNSVVGWIQWKAVAPVSSATAGDVEG